MTAKLRAGVSLVAMETQNLEWKTATVPNTNNNKNNTTKACKRSNGHLDQVAKDLNRERFPAPTRTRKKRRTNDSLREMEENSPEHTLDDTDPDYPDRESLAAFDSDDEELQAATAAEPIDVDSLQVNQDRKFGLMLRKCLSALVDKAKSPKREQVGDKTHLMMPCYWGLLGRVLINYLVKLFMLGIPEEGQSLFEKGAWTSEDLLSISSHAVIRAPSSSMPWERLSVWRTRV